MRINALLVRRPAAAANPVGRYQFDPTREYLLLDNGQETRLSHREAELLRHLYTQRNQVLERAPVLRARWGDDSFFNGRSLAVFITRLLRHLKGRPPSADR